MYGVIRLVPATDSREFADVTVSRPEEAVSWDQYVGVVLMVLQETDPELYQRTKSGDMSEWVNACATRVSQRFDFPSGASLPAIEAAAREVISQMRDE